MVGSASYIVHRDFLLSKCRNLLRSFLVVSVLMAQLSHLVVAPGVQMPVGGGCGRVIASTGDFAQVALYSWSLVGVQTLDEPRVRYAHVEHVLSLVVAAFTEDFSVTMPELALFASAARIKLLAAGHDDGVFVPKGDLYSGAESIIS